jgi:hypothetical protein
MDTVWYCDGCGRRNLSRSPDSDPPRERREPCPQCGHVQTIPAAEKPDD